MESINKLTPIKSCDREIIVSLLIYFMSVNIRQNNNNLDHMEYQTSIQINTHEENALTICRRIKYKELYCTFFIF